MDIGGGGGLGGGLFAGVEAVLGVFLFLLFSSNVCVCSVAHVTIL